MHEEAADYAVSPCDQRFLLVVHCQLSEAVVDGVAGALKAILFVWGLFAGRNLADYRGSIPRRQAMVEVLLPVDFLPIIIGIAGKETDVLWNPVRARSTGECEALRYIVKECVKFYPRDCPIT